MNITEVNKALATIAAKSKPQLVALQRGDKTNKLTLAERLKAVKLMRQIKSLRAKLETISIG